MNINDETRRQLEAELAAAPHDSDWVEVRAGDLRAVLAAEPNNFYGIKVIESEAIPEGAFYVNPKTLRLTKNDTE